MRIPGSYSLEIKTEILVVREPTSVMNVAALELSVNPHQLQMWTEAVKQPTSPIGVTILKLFRLHVRPYSSEIKTEIHGVNDLS